MYNKSKRKNKKEAQNMIKAESVARVYTHIHTHISNLLKNKQANKISFISDICKTDYKKVVCFYCT